MKKLLSLIFAMLILLTALSGCGKAEIVMEVLGYDVSYDLYRFYVMTAKENYGLLDETGKTVSTDSERLALAEQAALDAIVNLCSARRLSEDLGFPLDGEVVWQGVEAYYDKLLLSYESEKALLADMATAYMTEDVVRLVYGVSYAQERAYEKALVGGDIDGSDEGLQAFYASDNVVRVKHIFIAANFNDAEGAAEKALKNVMAAESFEAAMEMYSTGGFYTEDRYVARGETYEPFEEAAFSLDIGEISGIVETSAGYSIICRYEKNAFYWEEEKESCLETYRLYQFNQLLEKIKANAEITYRDAFADYPFVTIE